MSLAALVNRYRHRRLVRPWALSAPILVLLIAIPLLRPLRSPDPRGISDDEQARLATVQAIVEGRTLAIEGTEFRSTRQRIAVGPHLYSSQPPMMSVLLSGPYWVMHHFGRTFARDGNWVSFWLTLLGVTLPAALSAGLVYRMSRLFELRRPLRAALAIIVVIGSGLLSYATVLNAHAPAATLLLAAAACLFHLTIVNSPLRGAGWLAAAGLCAALAATIDPPAVVFLVVMLLVVPAFRWPAALRAEGMLIYMLGAVGPVYLHAVLVKPVTGDLRPGFMHPELGAGEDSELADGQGSGFRVQAAVRVVKSGSGEKESSPHEQVAANSSDKFTETHSGAPLGTAIPSSLNPQPRTLNPPTDDDDDEPRTFWRIALRDAGRVVAAFIGNHGILSHFPIVLFGIVGVSLIMHRHWPATTKTLAGVTLGGGLAVILFYVLSRSDIRDSMFATGWFVVFLPLTLFWAGAWLRRRHRQGTWVVAGVFLAFSMSASIIGATGPLPRDGFDHYSLAGAWQNLVHPKSAAPMPPVLADRRPAGGDED